MARDMPSSEENRVPSVQFFCFNDEFLAVGEDDLLDCYISEEEEQFNSLGIIINLKKSYKSLIGFSFAERYFIFSMLTKDAYERFWAYTPLLGVNIAHAKILAVGLNPSTAMVDLYRRVWGYEFFPEEHNYPYSLGGWTSPQVKLTDTTLVSYPEYYPIFSKAAAAVAAGAMVYRKRDLKGKSKRPLAPRAAQKLFLTDEQLKELGYKSEFHMYASRSEKNVSRLNAYYKLLLSRRAKIFKSSPFLNQTEFEDKYFLSGDLIIPGATNIEYFAPPLSEDIVTFPDLANDTPRLSWLKFHNKCDLKDVEVNRHAINVPRSTTSRLLDNDFRARIKYYDHKDLGEITLSGNPGPEFMASFKEPALVYMVSKGYWHNVPVPKEKYRRYPHNRQLWDIAREAENFECKRFAFLFFDRYPNLFTPEGIEALHEELRPPEPEAEPSPERVINSIEDITIALEDFPMEFQTKEIPPMPDLEPLPGSTEPSLEDLSLIDRYRAVSLNDSESLPAEIRALYYASKNNRLVFLKSILPHLDTDYLRAFVEDLPEYLWEDYPEEEVIDEEGYIPWDL